MQSDDVHAKKPAPIFIKNVVSALKTHDVVIADKYVCPSSLPTTTHPYSTGTITCASTANSYAKPPRNLTLPHTSWL